MGGYNKGMSILGQNRKAKFIGEDMHEAYTAFYNRYYSFMYERAKYKLNGKSHTAQDVVQTCMIEIYKEKVFNLLMNLEERVVRSYVISMVDNCVIDYYRSQKIYKLEPIDDLKKHEDKSNSLKKDVLKIEFLDMINNVKGFNTMDKRLIKYISLYDVKMVELTNEWQEISKNDWFTVELPFFTDFMVKNTLHKDIGRCLFTAYV